MITSYKKASSLLCFADGTAKTCSPGNEPHSSADDPLASRITCVPDRFNSTRPCLDWPSGAGLSKEQQDGGQAQGTGQACPLPETARASASTPPRALPRSASRQPRRGQRSACVPGDAQDDEGSRCRLPRTGLASPGPRVEPPPTLSSPSPVSRSPDPDLDLLPSLLLDLHYRIHAKAIPGSYRYR